MGGPTPPYARVAADITDASASGRSVLTGTAAQGATALGVGAGSMPTFAGLAIGGGGGYSPGAFYSDAAWGLLIRVRVGGSYNAFGIKSADDLRELLTITDAGNASFGGPLGTKGYTVATLPAGAAGALVYASNGRKVGEAAGSGTGVIVCFSNGAWRRLSDDTAVAA